MTMVMKTLILIYLMIENYMMTNEFHQFYAKLKMMKRNEIIDMNLKKEKYSGLEKASISKDVGSMNVFFKQILKLEKEKVYNQVHVNVLNHMEVSEDVYKDICDSIDEDLGCKWRENMIHTI